MDICIGELPPFIPEGGRDERGGGSGTWFTDYEIEGICKRHNRCLPQIQRKASEKRNEIILYWRAVLQSLKLFTML